MFEAVMKRVLTRLQDAKKKKVLEDFALIGAFAVSRWGVPRATQDIDFIIRVEPEKLRDVAEILRAKLRVGDIHDPILSAMTITEKDKHGVIPIQLLQFPPAWENLAFEEIDKQKLAKVVLPIVHWKALVLLKLYAGSPLDFQDAENILKTVAPSKSDLKTLEQKATALRVSKRLVRILEKD